MKTVEKKRTKIYYGNSGSKLKYILLTAVIAILGVTEIISQPVSVTGNITSKRFPVKFAVVTLIDQGDTTITYKAVTDAHGNYTIDNITSVENEINSVPANFELEQNYPNPFSKVTAIPYKLKERADVKVTIYDILGREVRKFTVATQSAGIHNILWDGKNLLGKQAANGAYIYKLESSGKSVVKKMILNHSSVSNQIPILRANNFNNSFAKISSQKISKSNLYKLEVSNTNTTLPFIKPYEISDVKISNDTTIDLALVSIPVTTIDKNEQKQVIRGFGAATPWYRPVARDTEIQSAFGKGNGELGLNILRLTLDPNPNNWSKWIPSAKKAYELGAKIIASPWYAPSEMIERVGNRNKIKQDMYDEYAAHLNSYVEYMSENGVPIYGLSIQNEPDISEDWTWWDPEDMLRFMRDFAHLIKGTLVMAPESFQFRKNISDPILNDPVATENTDIICGHIYGAGLTDYPLAAEKGKEVWMTEYLIGENNSANNIGKCIELALNVNDVMKSNMSAYVWWTMIRYYGLIGDGGKAANPADPREEYPDKGEVTKKGYVLSQFSKFVEPGFFRVGSANYPTTSSINVTAYVDPASSKLVVIAVNPGSTAAQHAFRIGDDTVNGTLSRYTTSESKNFEQGEEVAMTNGSFIIELEPQSITTFIYE